MKIEVRVKPGAKKQDIEKQADGTLVVKIKEPAREGRANEAVIQAVAGHFSVPKHSVTILRGHRSRTKLIEVAK